MTDTRPNILLITSDQQHWNTLGCINPEIRTPNLDELASQGALFTRAYCPNPTCTPTRASMITGKYPSQHGAWSLGTKLPESEHTVGEDFAAAGYRTALVGKAHFQPLQGTDEFPSLEAYPILQDLDFWREFKDPFYGFEHVELARNHTDEAHVGQHYALWMEEKGLKNWRDYYRKPTGNVERQRHRWAIPEAYHYDAWIAERTNALLDRYAKGDERFFLWASFFDPHPSYLVPEPWDTLYDPEKLTVPSVVEGEHADNPPHFKLTQQRKPDFSPWRESGFGLHGFSSHLHDRKALAKDIAVYYGMITLMDKYIGTILDKLDALGLAENTVVVFTTDHGHFYGHHGLTAKGAFHYEDMIKIPFLVRYPGRVPAGRRSAALQTLVDLPQTFLSFAGIPAPRAMTGVDQSQVWCGGQDRARDHIIVENRHEPTTIHVKTYVDERYKLTVYFKQEYGELFDLREDPGEIRNLWNSESHQALKNELTMKLLFAEMGKEPLWMPRISGA
ncbi:MAG: sulfatase-like hydrolase/transferase [Kiritimatiellae bacterium]|nr:sulfatase-like hydrolase/transferase [Kiritimatiellia bacterium]